MFMIVLKRVVKSSINRLFSNRECTRQI